MQDRQLESADRPRLSPGRLLAAGLFGLLLLPFESHATVYKWVDENGVSHYTTDPDQVPRGFRGRWRSIEEATEEVAPEPQDPEDLEAIPAARVRAPHGPPAPVEPEPPLAALPGPKSRPNPTAPRPRQH